MSVSKRGFGSMDKERQRAIAAQGGRAAHKKGTAHQFTPEEAKRAGSLGGLRTQELKAREKGRVAAADDGAPAEVMAEGPPPEAA